MSVRYIDLSSNYLSDPLPEGFSSLKNLQFADLHANLISGSLPEDIGNLAALTCVTHCFRSHAAHM